MNNKGTKTRSSSKEELGRARQSSARRGEETQFPGAHGVSRPTILLFQFTFVSLCLCGSNLFSASVDETKLPPPAATQIDFTRDIQPIFENSCYRCHGPEKPKSKFRRDNRVSALKGGENGIDIIPGNSAKSPLIHYVTRSVLDLEMPPEGKGKPLTKEQIALLRAWIDQGANYPTTNLATHFEFSITPTIGFAAVSGNKSSFREHQWMRDGWSGGAQTFLIQEKTSDDTTVSAEGHAVVGNEDYQLKLALEKNDVGFVRGGVEQYRKYFDDNGGFYPSFNPPLYNLGRDLHLDIGRAWIDFGLTRPDWPRLTLGYEYQYKEGAKSLLEWGDVTATVTTPGGRTLTTTRKIFPSFQEISERTHIIKFDVAHEIADVQLENNFRAEFFNSDTVRHDVVGLQQPQNGPDKIVRVNEGYHHFQAVNAFRAEKQIWDWLFVSAGHLFTHLDADASLNQDTFLTPNAALPPATTFTSDDKSYHANGIVLRRDSQTANFNTLLGPFDELTISGGAQGEWSRQDGFGNRLPLAEAIPGTATFFTNFATLASGLESASAEENFAVRYSKIPYTVLFAETRLRQESIGQTENESGGTPNDFVRDTDADNQLKEYRVGFTASPWSRLSLTAHYKYHDNQSDYNHLKDTQFGFPNQGYSAFITGRDLKTDEILAKLVWHPANWLKTTFTYQTDDTDFRTVTKPEPDMVTDPVTGAPVPISRGGPIEAGKYNSDVYSVNFTLSPWRRFYTSTTLSYRDSKTTTAHNGIASVAPYQGDVYSVMSSANYSLNAKTDLLLSYWFSRADYRQNNFAAGLPVGLAYDWHGVNAGVSRKVSKNVTTSLQYGFYHYAEPSSGGFNDYAAHTIFATLAVRLP